MKTRGMQLKRTQHQRLLKAALLLGLAFISSFAAKGLASVIQILLVRKMGVEQYGIYTTLSNAFAMVVTIGGLGLNTWLLKQGRNTEEIYPSINKVFSLRAIATTVLALGLGLIFIIFNSFPVSTQFIMLFVVLTIGEVLVMTSYTALRLEQRNTTASFFQMVVPLITLLLIWVLWVPSRPLFSIGFDRVLAVTVGVGLTLYLFHPHLEFIYRLRDIRSLLSSARDYFLSDVLTAIALRVDVVLLGLLVSHTAAGIYNPPLMIINLSYMVPQVLWQILLPRLAREADQPARRRRLMLPALALSIVYGVGCFIVLMFGAEQVMLFFYGAKDTQGTELLHIMSPIPLLKSLGFCWAMLMIALHDQRRRLKLQATGALTNLFGNLIFLPFFAAVGAAWVNLASQLLLTLAYSWGAWRSVRGGGDEAAAG